MAGILRAAKLVNLGACVTSVLRSRHFGTQTCLRWSHLRCDGAETHIPRITGRQLSWTAVQFAGVSDRQQSRNPRYQGGSERLLQNLDSQVQRNGRVDKKQVQNLLKVLMKEGNPSSQQAIMLLRCCGSLLVKESSQKRSEIFRNVWDQLQNMGVPIGISFYNAALRIQLENEMPFSVTKVLEEIESKNLIPNRVTYQLLIASYCEDGDIEGAKKILEYMQTQEMTITEAVFHSFIKAHLRAGDTDSAQSVLESMRKARVETSANTYRVLMVGFAEKGDIRSIVKTVGDAEHDEVTLHASQLLDVAVSIVRHGYSEHLSQILEMLPPGQYNHDIQNCTYQLIALGHDNEAFEVYKRMEPTVMQETDSNVAIVGSSREFLRTMMINNRPLEQIEKMHEQLKSFGANQDDTSRLTLTALSDGVPDLALALIKRMKEQSLPVRPHYYQPVFIAYEKDQNTEGIYNAVKHMIEMVPGHQSELFNQIDMQVLVRLKKLNQSTDIIIEKMKAAGMSEENCNGIKVSCLIESGHLQKAAEIMRSSPVALSPGVLKTRLIQGFDRSNGDWESILEILSLTEVNLGISLVDLNGSILSLLTKPGSLEPSGLDSMVNQWLVKKLVVTAKFYSEIQNNLSAANVSDATKEEMKGLFTSAYQSEFLSFKPKNSRGHQLMKKSIEELETLYEEAKHGKKQVVSIEKWLLSNYAYHGKIAKAEHMKAVLDGKGFIYNSDLLRQLGIMEAHHKGNLEEALEYKKKIETQYPEYQAYGQLVLYIAQLYLARGDLEAGLEQMQNYSSHHRQSLQASGIEDGYSLSWLALDLMTTTAKSLGTEGVGKVMDALFDLGFVKSGTFSVLESYVKHSLTSDDLDQPLSAMEHCVKKYTRAPLFTHLFCKFIELEDAERLQKAVDLVSSIHDEMDILHNLIFAFVECGKYKQARKIVETPGLRAIMPKLIEECSHFIRMGKVKELEQVVDITRSLFDIDRDEMMFQLIRAHLKESNYSKALDVYFQYEEQNVLPKPRTLRYLGKALQSANQPVPFDIPAIREKDVFKWQASNSQEDEAIEAIVKGDITFVRTMLENSAPGTSCLSAGFLAEIFRHLKERKRKQNVKHLLHVLGTVGAVDTLQQLKHVNETLSLGRFVHQRLFLAYIYSNRSEEILDYLHKNPALVAEYSTSRGLMELVKRNPELLPKLEEIVAKYTTQSAERNVHNHLFCAYYLTGRYSEAELLLKDVPTIASRLNMNGICRVAREMSNEDSLVHLVELMRPVGVVQLVNPYSSLIMIKCNDGDWQGGLAYLEQAKGEGLNFTDLWFVPLSKLEALLKENNQPIPWPEGSLQRSQRAADSESSDDEASARN